MDKPTSPTMGLSLEEVRRATITPTFIKGGGKDKDKDKGVGTCSSAGTMEIIDLLTLISLIFRTPKDKDNTWGGILTSKVMEKPPQL